MPENVALDVPILFPDGIALKPDEFVAPTLVVVHPTVFFNCPPKPIDVPLHPIVFCSTTGKPNELSKYIHSQSLGTCQSVGHKLPVDTAYALYNAPISPPKYEAIKLALLLYQQ